MQELQNLASQQEFGKNAFLFHIGVLKNEVWKMQMASAEPPEGFAAFDTFQAS